MGKEPLTTRLDADTKQRVEDYAENHDIGQTEAARRLIRSGLAAEGYPLTAAGGSTSLLQRLGSTRTVAAGGVLLALSAVLVAAASWFTSTGNFGATVIAASLGTTLAFLSVATVATAALAQIALARPLKGLLGLGSEVSGDD